MRAHVGVMLAATCLLSVAAVAQEKTYVEAIGNVRPVALPPGGPPPRLSDGHIDFSGVWFSGIHRQGECVERGAQRAARPAGPDSVPAVGQRRGSTA